MEYNSQKDLLIIPEYGRNMQELIRHAFTIEGKEERKIYLEDIINLMQQMHPQSRNVADSKLKLWEHVVRIAEDDLGIELPEGISAEEIGFKKPDMINYPVEVNKFRHYGINVRTMIAKAVEMEDGPVKEGFVKTIASYMKMAYRNWHKELHVNDDVIKGDLKSISKGKLELSEGATIEVSAQPRRKPSSSSNYRNNNRNSRNNNRDRDNRNNNRNRRR